MALSSRIRDKLYAARERRARPARDEKILTSWNALTIKGMARAGRLLHRPDLLESAQRATDFIRTRLWRNGRLLASYKDGHARLPAYLDDHAFLLDALMESLQAHWRTEDMQFAQALADLLLTHFEDPAQGSFFFTADDHETLVQRPRPFMDEATPAGNGIAALVLNRLGHLLAEPRYLQAAERTLRAVSGAMIEMPYLYSSLLNALEEYMHPPALVLIPADTSESNAWRDAAEKYYVPRRMVFVLPRDHLPQGIAQRLPPIGTALACLGNRCLLPANSVQELASQLATNA
jgi:uncharacterized protein YyaL (SSP411 family)